MATSSGRITPWLGRNGRKKKDVTKPDDEKRPPRKIHQKKKAAGAKCQARESSPITQDQKRSDEVAKSDNYCTVPPVVICCVTSILVGIGLWYIYHFLDQKTLQDAELEDINMFTVESLKALKRHTLQCHNTIYTMLLIFIVLCVSFGFAFILFYKDTLRYRAGMTAMAITRQKERDDLLCKIRRLENKEEECEDEIESMQQQNPELEGTTSIQD